MHVCEYVKNESGRWEYREYKNAAVFSCNLQKSHLFISNITLGWMRACRVRKTKWRDIDTALTVHLTHELLSGKTHLLKISDDFFEVLSEQSRLASQHKTSKFLLRYLEYKSINVIDLMIDSNFCSS